MKNENKPTNVAEKERPNLYDYLKVIAIITMVIDHVWYYFFPEALWLRLVGRIAFPIFLFLVWFSWSYRWRWDIPLLWVILWIASIFAFQAVGVEHFITGNILIGITVTRALLDLLKKFDHWTMDAIVMILCISVFGYFAHPYLNELIQYGSLSILFWLWWYIAKYHKMLFPYWIAVFIAHFVTTMWVFHFGKIAGSSYMPATLWLFFVVLYSAFFKISKNNSPMATGNKRDGAVLFLSNHALSIFAIHILLFLAIFVMIW